MVAKEGVGSVQARVHEPCGSLCRLPCLSPGPVSSSPMAFVLGLVLGRGGNGYKDLGFPCVCLFAEVRTQIGAEGFIPLVQLLLLAALRVLDLIFSLYFASCQFGAVVLSWLFWFVSRALHPLSLFLTNPLNECFSLLGVMGETGWPVGSRSKVVLELSWTISLWIGLVGALRRWATSSWRASLRADHCSHERNKRLTAFHQPCKLGDFDCNRWHLVTDDGLPVGNVVLTWLSWFVSRALRPISLLLTNPLTECFSFFGVMGEIGWPVGSPSKIALEASSTLSLWILTWHTAVLALRQWVWSSSRLSLRADHRSRERNMRLIIFHQPCKLGDCDRSGWHLFMDSGVLSVNPLILNGPSCKTCARAGYQWRVWSLLKIGTCYNLLVGVTVVTSALITPWLPRRLHHWKDPILNGPSSTSSRISRSSLSTSFHFQTNLLRRPIGLDQDTGTTTRRISG